MFDSMKHLTPTNKRFLLKGLTLTILFQLTVLATEYIYSVWPLWFGTPIALKTAPVDPRSLFRGNYVFLNYDVSMVSKVMGDNSFKQGEVVYVSLKRDDQYFVATSLHRSKPESGTFIRGRIYSIVGSNYRIKYGIEAYFMPKAKAQKVQKDIGQGATATIYLLNSGKAAISKLHCISSDC